MSEPENLPKNNPISKSENPQSQSPNPQSKNPQSQSPNPQSENPQSAIHNPLPSSGRLPDWAEELARKYRVGEASHFLLHHNVYDLIRSRNGYVSLLSFLQQELLCNRRVLLYIRREGVEFDSEETLRAFVVLLRVAHSPLDFKTDAPVPPEPVPSPPL